MLQESLKLKILRIVWLKWVQKLKVLDKAKIRIRGVQSLTGTTHHVICDRIECGTYAIALALTGGKLVLESADKDLLTALWTLLLEAGVTLEFKDDQIIIESSGTPSHSVDVETCPYPGFPTDLQAQFMALMTLADGVSVVHETIFENRFMHVPELCRMGADISTNERKAIIRGVKELRSAPVMATDLRASVSLIIAALKAKGESVVHRIYHLDRGFETA